MRVELKNLSHIAGWVVWLLAVCAVLWLTMDAIRDNAGRPAAWAVGAIIMTLICVAFLRRR